MINQCTHHNMLFKVLISMLAFSVFFSACEVINPVLDLLPDRGTSSRENEVDLATPIETAATDPIATQVPTDFDVITIWIEPQFDPALDTPQSELLRDHVKEYVDQNPGVKISFRLKEATGPNSIMNALSITSEAAPDALPTIVLLSRQNMEKAANEGLIRPIDFYTNAFEKNDWYPFANKLGLTKNEMYGLPFVANLMVLGLESEIATNTYLPLTDSLRQFGRIGFAAGNPASILPFLWYQSAGGDFDDETGRSNLEGDPLEAVFSAIRSNTRSGNFPSLITQYDLSSEVWDAFKAGDFESVITWSDKILADDQDISMTFLPAISQAPYTYADGWVWCLVQKSTTDIERNLDFMHFLVLPEFLKKYSANSPYLPVRPSSINSDATQSIFIDDLLLSADILPPLDIRISIQALFSAQIQRILQEEISPAAAVENMFNALEEVQESE